MIKSSVKRILSKMSPSRVVASFRSRAARRSRMQQQPAIPSPHMEKIKKNLAILRGLQITQRKPNPLSVLKSSVVGLFRSLSKKSVEDSVSEAESVKDVPIRYVPPRYIIEEHVVVPRICQAASPVIKKPAVPPRKHPAIPPEAFKRINLLPMCLRPKPMSSLNVLRERDRQLRLEKAQASRKILMEANRAYEERQRERARMQQSRARQVALNENTFGVPLVLAAF